ncbi:IS861 transposase [Streptococcus sanguinis SK1059]|nr:IS861 transposase [Streptococcus sanguinis SK1059]EGQ21692.1 IS861 transposase [Streptococcus sanguinis ATCC 29667]
MSRKGNSPDNGMMESFFGILKSEMFYGYEKTLSKLLWTTLITTTINELRSN